MKPQLAFLIFAAMVFILVFTYTAPMSGDNIITTVAMAFLVSVWCYRELKKRVPQSTTRYLKPNRSRGKEERLKAQLIAERGASCAQCGSTDHLHLDHIIPWSRGGENSIDNVQLLCRKCNLAKSDRE